MSEKPKVAGTKLVPIPSMGHELGILFGFAGLMVISMTVYWIFWNRYQAKISKVEQERRRKLLETPLYKDHHDNGVVDEKNVTEGDYSRRGNEERVETVS